MQKQEPNQEWKAETDGHHGPHIRLYLGGKRTTVLILPKYFVQNKSNVPLSVIEKLKKLVQIQDNKPF